MARSNGKRLIYSMAIIHTGSVYCDTGTTDDRCPCCGRAYSQHTGNVVVVSTADGFNNDYQEPLQSDFIVPTLTDPEEPIKKQPQNWKKKLKLKLPKWQRGYR